MKKVKTEHEEQVQVVKTCRMMGLMAVAIPNGFHTNVKKDGRFFGMIASLKAEGYTKGFPDLIIMGNNGQSMFVEMKRTSGSATSKEQKALHESMTEAGHYVVVCKGADDAIGCIKEYFE